MAKVKIQGHASGTGVLTVTAPNTSTDRTITLPDATGTLATTADAFNPDAAVTINESSADVDFRVESNSNTHQLFVDGGNSMVMIDQVANPGTRALIGGESNGLQIKGNSNSSSYLGITRHSADADSPAIKFLKSRNTSVNSYTIVQDNDYLGEIGFHADDGTDYSTRGASIQARVDGTPGANDMPTKLLFNTTANGANDTTTRLSILNDGRGLSPFTCKAWARFSASALGDSHNCSSFTDNGTGEYTIAFTNNMPSANYAPLLTSHYNMFLGIGGAGTAPEVGNLRMGNFNDHGNREDGDWMAMAIFANGT